jgi:hypothetical protein
MSDGFSTRSGDEGRLKIFYSQYGRQAANRFDFAFRLMRLKERNFMEVCCLGLVFLYALGFALMAAASLARNASDANEREKK